jgi:hypothetical protein
VLILICVIQTYFRAKLNWRSSDIITHMSDPNSKSSDILSDGPVKDILRPGCVSLFSHNKFLLSFLFLIPQPISVWLSHPPLLVKWPWKFTNTSSWQMIHMLVTFMSMTRCWYNLSFAQCCAKIYNYSIVLMSREWRLV